MGEQTPLTLDTANQVWGYLQDILLALFYLVLQFLQLFRVEGWICFAVGLTRDGQLLLFACCVVGFLGCFYLQGEKF